MSLRLLRAPAETARPLPPRGVFLRHLARNAAVSVGLIGVSLGIGAVGYRLTADLPWVDALLNAAMILTGMGPVSPMTSDAAKLFATGYALFSGVAFLTAVSVLFAPAAHRFLHRFHLDVYDEAPKSPPPAPPEA